MTETLHELLKAKLQSHLGDPPWYEHIGVSEYLEEVVSVCKRKGFRVKGLHVSCVTLNRQTETEIVCIMLGDYVHEYHMAVLNENTGDLFEVGGRLNSLLEKQNLPTYTWNDSGDAIIGHIIN